MRLEGSDVACVRGGREVFAGLSFTVAQGQALLVTGSNGAGKSSLLRLIAGLLRPEAGSIALVDGDPDLTVGEQAHYVGHLDALKPALTVAENLEFWAASLGPRNRSAIEALEAVDLGDLAVLPAAYLSAGQRRRLSLARLITTDRPIWLLDEPTTALDAAGMSMLRRQMHDHLAGGGMIVAAAHGPIGLERAKELRLGKAT